MSNEFEEHWLSAYLDNELSADERALVEQRLQTDPAARQLLDDLKRVRSLVATLPGWQGGDLRAAIAKPDSGAIDLGPHAVEDGSDRLSTTPLALNRVEYSTSLAESRLRERENAAAAQTRRSMRWTTILAVAAGLATVMLGAPYFFRSRGPVTELAQHTDTPAEPESLESKAAQFDSIPPAEASRELTEMDRDVRNQPTTETSLSRSANEVDKAVSEANRSFAAPRDAEGGASVRSGSAQMKSTLQEQASEYRAKDAAAQADFDRSNSPRGLGGSANFAGGGGTALGGAAGGFGDAASSGLPPLGPMEPTAAAPGPATPGPATPSPATPSPATPSPATPSPATPSPATPSPATPSPATPSLVAPGPQVPGLASPEQALAMGVEQSRVEPPVNGLSDAAAPEDAFRTLGGAVMPPPSAPQTTPSLAPEVALRAEQQPQRAMGRASESTASPQPQEVVSARSEAWSDQEVQGAIDQVWYFVGPQAVGAAQQPPPAATARYQFAPSPPTDAARTGSTDAHALGRPAQGAELSEGVTAKSPSPEPTDVDQGALAKAPANEPAAAGGGVAAGASGNTAAGNTAAGSRATGQLGARLLDVGQSDAGQPGAKPKTASSAIGLARLPANAGASAWLERLRQEYALKPLQPLARNETLGTLDESMLGAPAEGRSPQGGAVAKNEHPQSQTLVLFVSAREARQILQSLQNEQSATEVQGRIQPQKQDTGEISVETVQPAKLPPAWWKLPLDKKDAAAAKAVEESGPEKVILILSQLPAD